MLENQETAIICEDGVLIIIYVYKRNPEESA